MSQVSGRNSFARELYPLIQVIVTQALNSMRLCVTSYPVPHLCWIRPSLVLRTAAAAAGVHYYAASNTLAADGAILALIGAVNMITTNKYKLYGTTSFYTRASCIV